MIVHPYKEREQLVTLQGSLLDGDFGLIGVQVRDTEVPKRVWTIQGFYSPIWGRKISGIRAKVRDQYGFVSFINQRDLEVLLGEGIPGDHCSWLGEEYVSPFDEHQWIGFAMDDDDLRDDLYDREMQTRLDWLDICGEVRPLAEVEIERSIYTGPKQNRQEVLYLFRDDDPETGETPDTKLSTVQRRWTRISITALRWEDVG